VGLKIAVLASDPALYANRRLLEAGADRGHETSFLNLTQCTMKLDAVEPEVHAPGGRIVAGLDAVIPRVRSELTVYGCALVRQFESMGVYALNKARALAQSRDRLYALQVLLNSGLDIPVTAFAKSPPDTADLVDMVGGAPVVLRLLEGSRGRGAVFAGSSDAARSVIDAYKSLQANILVQEHLEEAEGQELHCYVVNGRVIGSIQRDGAG
jgi:ribosomal protein S6--L-glutamate ligase